MPSQTIRVNAPDGIRARLLWDLELSNHDKRRILVKELVAEQLGCEPREVRVEREGPKHFGTHRRLVASVNGKTLDINVNTASYKAATLVALSDPSRDVGIDVRDYTPSPEDRALMERESHIPNEDNTQALVDHWSRVMAIIDAEGRTAWMYPRRIRLDSSGKKGWVRGHDVTFDLYNASQGTWVITFAVENPVKFRRPKGE